MDRQNELLRQIPKVDKLQKHPLITAKGPGIVLKGIRDELEEMRKRIIEGSDTDTDIDAIASRIIKRIEEFEDGSLRPVINACGVVIHTNLGRSPLPDAVFDEIRRAASGYSNLEYDLATGKRGDRYHHLRGYIRHLTGAEDALVVNNNAAAVFIILNTFAPGREVIVSRGELVEIGGSFRIPDVMQRSGAILNEAGTTNRTRIEDYRDACSDKTAMMMKVHKSNYSIVGFSEECGVSDIARAAREKGVISYYDAGSGIIKLPFEKRICGDETVSELVCSGVDLISFSGDKLLGGVQAGIIAGRKSLIDKIKKNQLLRMLRVDKLTLASLQAVLRLYINGEYEKIPVYRMLSEPAEHIKNRAERLVSMLSIPAKTVEDRSEIGGGSCPGAELPSWSVALETPSPNELEKKLRNSDTPIIAKIRDNMILFDMRTVDEGEIPAIAEVLNKTV
ncbi:L-seryl-tRNA(Sec) selenium transferase [Limisalsivibrio acetivorans]|uniref:L-seryl-tRNA(Sec) selenium transferase n=1 Tax=Limisalsivibrio acetivorans TaxID=1304888 RepID=UPI0003F5EF23|nr:L-seryl-tRNA(Sec) selenium transferase [Limisalsivibrio acetivorans]